MGRLMARTLSRLYRSIDIGQFCDEAREAAAPEPDSRARPERPRERALARDRGSEDVHAKMARRCGRSYSAPAALRTNGYDTMTMPPPCGLGNSQRLTACAMHCSTFGLFIVDCCTTDATTCPVPLMVNWI